MSKIDTHLLVTYHNTSMSKSDLTRHKIFEGAIECIAKNGFEQSSFTEIAKKTKVNRTLVTYYFGTKKKLIQELVKYAIRSGQIFTQQYLSKNSSSADLIEQYINATFQWYEDYPLHAYFLLLSFQRSYYDKDVQNIVAEMIEMARYRIQEMIKKYYPANPDLTALWADQLHSALLGFLLTNFAYFKKDTQEYKKQCVSLAKKIMKEN